MEKETFLKHKSDQPSFVQFALRIIPKILMVLLQAVLSLPLWPLYWVGWWIWYRPPNVPYLRQVRRYIRLTWTVAPEEPSLPVFGRIWLTLLILQSFFRAPLLGIAWLLDELIYGRKLNNIEVVQPIFVISAGRSGSTQITRYIEEDQRLAAPNILQCMVPYLWLWKFASITIGRVIDPEKIREKFLSTMPPALMERHEMDIFRADTFDAPFLSFHLHRLSLNLGPEVGKEEFDRSRILPHDEQIKKKDFVRMVDRLARKSLYFAGTIYQGKPRRFYLKSHLLFSAQPLSEFYPDACFLTVVRDPVSRLRSGINYMRVNPADPVLGPVPWTWLAATLLSTEQSYNQAEMAWFTRQDDTRRCVIRFSEFVNDLEATMKKVYQDCFDTSELPPHVPKDHLPRERKNYSVDRSLSELGISEDELREEMTDYIAWCHSSEA